MKRPTLQAAVEWIAHNDAPADEHTLDELAGLLTVVLVADLFGVEPETVAQAVLAERKKALY